MEDFDPSVFVLNTEVRFLGNVNSPNGIPNTDQPTKLILFLDSTVNPFHVWEKKNVLPDTKKSFNVNLYGKRQNCFKELPTDCKICVRAFKSLPNEFGRPCDMDFGSGSVELTRIITNQGWTTIWLKMHSVSQNYVMSKLQIKLNRKNSSSPPEVFVGSKNSPNMEEICSDDLGFFLFPPWSSSIGDDMSIISHNVGANTSQVGRKSFKVCSITESSPCFSKLLSNIDTESIEGSISKNNNSTEAKLCFEKKKLDEYFENYSVESEYFRDWIKGGDKINCPFYPSQVTVSETQLYLPFSSYVVYEPPKVDKSFWYGALKIMYDRRGFTEEEYISSFRSASIETKAIQAMDMICQYAHLMEYISDQVINPKNGKNEKIEIFGNACYTLCGDCEDLALVILQLFDDFTLRQNFERDNSILKEMQSILMVYIPFVCIEGVTCSHAQNQHEIEDKNKITGAHASVKCLPRHFFKKCLSSWDETHPILSSSLSFSAPSAGCPISYEKDALKPPFSYLPKIIDGDNFEEWEYSLPILLGEGTGMLNSGGEPDPSCPHHRRQVYSIPSVRCAKKPLYPKKGTSPFYKATMFGATNRFLRDFGVATFRFCRKTEGLIFDIARKPKFERGVLFPDLIHMKEDISLVPYGDSRSSVNRVEGRREFSPSLTCILNNTLNVRVKSRSLGTTLCDEEERITKTFETKSPTDLPCEISLRVVGHLSKLKQKLDKNRNSSSKSVCKKCLCKVAIYYDSYYISHKMCKDIYSNLKEKVCGMDFALERHSDVLSIWRLEFLFPCTSANDNLL